RWRSAALLGGALGAIAVGWNLRPARLETSGHTEPMESVDPQGAELRQQVSRCRSLGAAEDGSEPDWRKAASACEIGLELGPSDREANAQHEKVALERQASEDYSAARRAREQFKPEDALELLGRVPAASFYQRKATLLAAEAEEMIKKRAGEDCRKYFQA